MIKKLLVGILITSYSLLTIASQASNPEELNTAYKQELNNLKHKLSSALYKKLDSINYASDITIPAIVVLKDQADLSEAQNIIIKKAKTSFVVKKLWEKAKESQHDILKNLQKTEGLDFRQFYILNGLVLFNPKIEKLLEVAQRSDVEMVYYNPKNKKQKLPSTQSHDLSSRFKETYSSSPITLGVSSIKAPDLWEQGYKGQGVVIGIQDTGVDYKHPALNSKYRGKTKDGYNHNYSWHDSIHFSLVPGRTTKCGLDSSEPCDDSQHGTHVTGTTVGSEGDKNQVGVAPEAKWVGCRNMDGGNGTPATYIECYEYFLAPYANGVLPLDNFKNLKPELSVDVISNSWGCPESEGCDKEEMLLAVKAIKAAGIVNVLSAGNEGRGGCGTIGSQAATLSDYTFSVGAINAKTGRIAGFSSRGPSAYDQKIGPDVVAPGVSVKSSVPGGGYAGAFFSGTSMAGPHVAGLVALLISARPELKGHVDRIQDAITAGAEGKVAHSACGGLEIGDIPNNTYGHGSINAVNALNSL